MGLLALICIVCEDKPLEDPRVLKSIQASLNLGFEVKVWPLQPAFGKKRRSERNHPLFPKVTLRPYWGAYLRFIKWTTGLASQVRLRMPLFVFAFVILPTLAILFLFLLAPERPDLGSVLVVSLIIFFLGCLGIILGTLPMCRRAIRVLVRQALWGNLQRYCLESAPDLLYFHDLTVTNDFGITQLPDRPKIMWDAHEFYPGQVESNESRDEKVRAIAEVADSIDGFVAVNAHIAKTYQETIPGLPPATIVHNAADWWGAVDYDGRLHRAAGIALENSILLYHGYLHPNRGVDYLLEIADHLPENWTTVFMGEGRLKENVERAIEVQKESTESVPRVSLLPMVPSDELVFWTAGASLGAIFYEPRTINQELASPNKLWEYARAGVPTISYAGPFLKETIEGNGIGWVVDYSSSAINTADLIARLNEKDFAIARGQSLRFAQTSNSQTEQKELERALVKTLKPAKT